MAARSKSSGLHVVRHWLLLGALCSGFGLLGFKAVLLQWEQGAFLKSEGDRRTLRHQVLKPNRGRILDRNGEILAVSTPVDSIYIDPSEICTDQRTLENLATALDISADPLKARCQKNPGQRFAYVKRHLPPEQAQAIIGQEFKGVYRQREYRRYYPLGPLTSHVVGYTNIEDQGLEGLERKFEPVLGGEAGRDRLIKDNRGNVIAAVQRLTGVRNGRDVETSIDARVQYATRQALLEAMEKFGAASATAIVVDVNSGEVLSLVNLPDFNPNLRNKQVDASYRNRAVTDTMEPGSTIKPFTVAMALESGRYNPDTTISTSPGKLRIGKHTISDINDYGDLSVSRVVVKSSNVGTAKIALRFEPEELFDSLSGFGFGTLTGIELPGEQPGSLPRRKRPIEHATMSYGYGLSASAMQLVRAYTVLANDGVMVPLTLQKRSVLPEGRRVISEQSARAVTHMLERVASVEGTARRAQVAQYSVAGKTGTTHKLINGNYKNKRYLSSFAGFAPASDPRFAMVVVVDDPASKQYYGGLVAAPVFSRVMAETLRLYNVLPDDVDLKQVEFEPRPADERDS